jgi:hypothetical protein
MYSISRCPCGDKTCEDWHVDPVAAVQGVKFTEQQAQYVAASLNALEGHEIHRVTPEMHMEDVVKNAAEDPLEFAHAFLEHVGTDALESFIRTCDEVFTEEGTHK